VTVLGGLLHPMQGLAVALGHPTSQAIERCQLILCFDISAIGGLREQNGRLAESTPAHRGIDRRQAGAVTTALRECRAVANGNSCEEAESRPQRRHASKRGRISFSDMCPRSGGIVSTDYRKDIGGIIFARRTCCPVRSQHRYRPVRGAGRLRSQYPNCSRRMRSARLRPGSNSMCTDRKRSTLTSIEQTERTSL